MVQWAHKVLLYPVRVFQADDVYQPQPPSSFLLGHLKVMGEAAAAHPPNCHPQSYYSWIANKYDLKGIWYLDLWPVAPSQVIVTTPELMDQVHVTRAFKQHKLSQDFLAPIVGRDVIATANGAVWKQLHNAMSPAFSTSHIRNLTGLIVEETMRFRVALSQFSQSGQVFSMEETSAKLTQGSSYLDDLREMVVLQEAQLSLNPLVKLRAAWKKRAILARLHPAITAQVKERLRLLRKEQIVPSRKDPYSILDLMLREQLQTGGEELKGADADAIAPQYLELLLTNIKGLLLGGQGTTTDTLCYIYMLLSKHPEAVRKLREEHARVFSSNFETTLQMVQDAPHKLQELEYTTGVIKETLHLFPVGFGLREAQEGATVSYKGRDYPVDNGLGVVAFAHGLHYDGTYCPEPTKFKPERFLDTTDQTANRCFRTFSRGARACLGQNLAITELQIILLMTVRDFEFELVNDVQWQRPNERPRVDYTDLDTVYGEVIFQELGIEAKPRGGMMMKVAGQRSETQWGELKKGMLLPRLGRSCPGR